MNAKQKKIRQLAARYPQVIEWNEEDDCYIGSAPPLIGYCCHGATSSEVAKQLDAIVLDLCEDIVDGKIPTPKAPMAGKQYSGKFVVRLSPALHKKVALKAQARDESLNQFVADALERV